MIKVGVFGAGGRMGAEVCRAVMEDKDLVLVAAVDPPLVSEALDPIAGLSGSDLIISEERDALAVAGAEIAVDFTVAEAAYENIRWCIENGVHAVVGTTGLTPNQMDKLELLQKEVGRSNVFIAPNFAIGAVLMMEFAKQAAKFLPDAEIIELHHPGKKDAPSGTAIKTAEGIVGNRTQSPTRAESSELMPGARGAEKDDVRVHSVRLPGLVAHQEVIFGGPGQTLSIRHDSTDRISFMPGVLLAIKRVAKAPGVTVGLEHLIEDDL
jgi:4-hydroxy-tetrahydrodipicolinate reductase